VGEGRRKEEEKMEWRKKINMEGIEKREK